jgi:hypothetical protein
MPYDASKDPFADSLTGRHSFGTKGESFTVGASDVELARYAYAQVYAPSNISNPVLYVLPAGNADGAWIPFHLQAGESPVLPWLLRTIAGTGNGSTAGLIVKTLAY